MKKILSDHNDNFYKVYVGNGGKYDATLSTFLWGYHFAMYVCLCRLHQAMDNFPLFTASPRVWFIKFCRQISASTRSLLKNHICDKNFCAFTAVFDGAENRGDAYLDVRPRFYAKCTLYNVHGLDKRVSRYKRSRERLFGASMRERCWLG